MSLSSNSRYIEEVLEVVPSRNPQYYSSMLDRMSAYEKQGNPWWFTYRGNPVELAARQVDEDFLLIPMEDFRKGLSKVIGRRVEDREISRLNKPLFDEFRRKYAIVNGKK